MERARLDSAAAAADRVIRQASSQDISAKGAIASAIVALAEAVNNLAVSVSVGLKK